MSDGEVLVEYLQLLSLDYSSLTVATSNWLRSAIIDYRVSLADRLAANATASVVSGCEPAAFHCESWVQRQRSY